MGDKRHYTAPQPHLQLPSLGQPLSSRVDAGGAKQVILQHPAIIQGDGVLGEMVAPQRMATGPVRGKGRREVRQCSRHFWM